MSGTTQPDEPVSDHERVQQLNVERVRAEARVRDAADDVAMAASALPPVGQDPTEFREQLIAEKQLAVEDALAATEELKRRQP